MLHLRKNLKYLRKHTRYTAGALSVILNVRLETYLAWENRGIQPGVENLKRISDFFKVSIDYLIKKDLSQIPQQTVLTNYFEIIAKLPCYV